MKFINIIYKTVLVVLMLPHVISFALFPVSIDTT